MGDMYKPSGELQGENTGPLPDAGCGTGFLGTSHGVDFSIDATQSMGGIAGDTGSDDTWARTNTKEQAQTLGSNSPAEDFTGSIGPFDGGSAAPGEENVNDTDAGQRETHNYA